MIVNINDHVQIRPKPEAFRIYAEYYAFRRHLKVDGEGWATLQLHEIMAIFGPSITPDHMTGCPFETEIRLSDVVPDRTT
jgi:hypothetical protein